IGGRAQNEGFTFSKTANSRLSWTVVAQSILCERRRAVPNAVVFQVCGCQGAYRLHARLAPVPCAVECLFQFAPTLFFGILGQGLGFALCALLIALPCEAERVRPDFTALVYAHRSFPVFPFAFTIANSAFSCNRPGTPSPD